jgi:hypothetical protein
MGIVGALIILLVVVMVVAYLVTRAKQGPPPPHADEGPRVEQAIADEDPVARDGGGRLIDGPVDPADPHLEEHRRR